MNKDKINYLNGDFTKIVIETDEENPTTIAVITNDETDFADGYRIRYTPKYD